MSVTPMINSTSHAARPLSVLICALGGEGGGVLSDWLMDIARKAGYAALATSIPGVAQRTGATTYFFELYPVPIEQLAGRKPVFSLNPIPGALDVVIASELLEAARCASNGLPSSDRTVFITSTSRTLTTAERTIMGDGRLDTSALLALVQSVSRVHHAFDMQRVAADNATVVSAVMLGALAASGVLPFDRALCEEVIREGGRGAQASLHGFAAAWQMIAQKNQQAAQAQQLINLIGDTEKKLPELSGFPIEIMDMLSLGYDRVNDYQDKAYGQLYLSRVQSVLDAERRADTASQNGFQTTREMSRWLALWMSFDDIVRVADLKSRASRRERVRHEARVKPSDVLAVYEHFKPGIPEIAGLLPKPVADRLLAWDQQRLAEGKEAWSMPVKLASHTVLGTALLRLIAACKYIRRFGIRYAQEQTLIEEWLSAVIAGMAEDTQLGYELALCGRLMKGYGATNERSRDHVLHVMRHVATTEHTTPAVRADAIRRAREAALTDEAGTQLDRVLKELGAPARPIKAQPIRWMPRTKNTN
ncbi:MAG: indolepyruvate oxidoreductase subunit beta family protein [bacterium]|jgi:indolepyruvate ferredoxin oxidoreductase beta subunit